MKATAMTDGDLRDQIARLESDIEHLAEGLERCQGGHRRRTESQSLGLGSILPTEA